MLHVNEHTPAKWLEQKSPVSFPASAHTSPALTLPPAVFRLTHLRGNMQDLGHPRTHGQHFISQVEIYPAESSKHN